MGRSQGLGSHKWHCHGRPHFGRSRVSVPDVATDTYPLAQRRPSYFLRVYGRRSNRRERPLKEN